MARDGSHSFGSLRGSSFVLAAMLSCMATAAEAGAWLQPRGVLFLKTSWISSQTRDGLDCRGHTREVDQFGGRYEVRQVFGYVEYGAQDWFTLVGSWSYKDQRISDARIPEYGTRSTGDIRLGGRLPLRRGRFPVSVEVTGSVPTYGSTDLSSPVADREQFLPAGSGRTELETGLQSGLSLYPLPLYANAALSRRWRGGDFGDQWQLRTEVGASTPRVFAKVEFGWILPTGDPCGAATVGNVAIHERVVTLAPEVGVRARGDLWVHAGLSTVASGRNTLDGNQWSLGLSWIRR